MAVRACGADFGRSAVVLGGRCKREVFIDYVLQDFRELIMLKTLIHMQWQL